MMRFSRAALTRWLRSLTRPSPQANLRRLHQSGTDIASFRIREAGVVDVPALAELHVKTWNATHRVVLGRGPTVQLRASQWREKFRSAPSCDSFCFVVEQDGSGMVGFASGARGHYPGFSGQLTKIYLLREFQRLGLGRRLFGHAARRFLDCDIDAMMLFSQVENPSCGFFEALGGERLLSKEGEFHGAYGWRDLRLLAPPISADIHLGEQ